MHGYMFAYTIRSLPLISLHISLAIPSLSPSLSPALPSSLPPYLPPSLTQPTHSFSQPTRSLGSPSLTDSNTRPTTQPLNHSNNSTTHSLTQCVRQTDILRFDTDMDRMCCNFFSIDKTLILTKSGYHRLALRRPYFHFRSQQNVKA